MKAIRVKGLTKRFSQKRKKEGFAGSVRALFRPEFTEKTAVRGIDLEVEAGEFLAFLGPNGAGKSTTIKMLTGILHPSEGEAEVLGFCPWKERKKLAYRIGSVFGQKSQLWYHLPPSDTFELMRRIYELDEADYRKRRGELIERFELGPYIDVPVRKLSLGERMRCEIAAALLHRPGIVFLDEPTIGLDVVVKMKIRELLREMNEEENITVFLTSHDAGDIEQLCRRAIVINHGQIMLDSSMADMKRLHLTRKTIALQLKERPEPIHYPGVEQLEAGDNRLKLSVDTSQTSIEQVLAFIVSRYRLDDVTIEDPPMEKIITHIYDRHSGGRDGG
ncbi:ABC transporter ATP-binding protein [Paenibacillus ginsengarvi]|uniref:ATP-binding cassette domain-containing protein n=1 Tax=Paenibacillus ginsengarvi TaxID=400777 RepID=A0A3B0CSP5_9BACL|nr:ATP-binding cassette domain-containing protein [Paenibacillus ginsengarvi]RKN86718.1 ATP-binding cassette domain-containing protein [Paenibacillus ginsengarvi]